jgi:hypothetical protein
MWCDALVMRHQCLRRPSVWRNPAAMLDAAAAPAGPDIAALARVHGVAAIQRLVQVLDGPDAAASVEAARELLDRAYGRPPQSLSLDAGGIHIELDTAAEAEQPYRTNGESAKPWAAGTRSR